MDFIINNIDLIQTIASIVFSVTISVVTILTYLRAKEKFLQPVRSEVIKKQTDILTSILNELAYSRNSIEEQIDYINLSAFNALKTAIDYGYIFKDQEKILDKVDVEITGKCMWGKKLRSMM